MVRRSFFALLILILAACGADSGTGSSEALFTPAPIPTINQAFLQREPTAIPPTATPTTVPTAVPIPTATPDVLVLSSEYANPVLGIFFTHPLDWIVDSTTETQLLAGLPPAVASSRTLTRTKPAELVMSISAEQSNGSNPLTLLANN